MQRLGGFDHAFAIRKEHWTVEYAPTALTPSDDSAAPVTAAAAVKQKRLQQKKRTAKLADLLQQMCHESILLHVYIAECSTVGCIITDACGS